MQHLVIANLAPTQKDIDRVEDFAFFKRGYRNWFYGNGAPIASNASKMAKLISDPEKLVRRARAVVQRWGTEPHYGLAAGRPVLEDVWTPFRNRLVELGFSREQIREISNS